MPLLAVSFSGAARNFSGYVHFLLSQLRPAKVIRQLVQLVQWNAGNQLLVEQAGDERGHDALASVGLTFEKRSTFTVSAVRADISNKL